MEQIIYFLIAVGASTIGAIAGIGGGVIIKPVMDSIGTMTPATVSWFSGCTVLVMALASYLRNLKSEVKLNYAITIYLAIGASFGGYLGKLLLSSITSNLGIIQATILLIVNVGVLIYVIFKSRLNTLHVKNPAITLVIGFLLGLISAFLGIGGGPINIAVLSYFFSMQPKETAKNSLFIILFSQATSFTTTLITHTIPDFNIITMTLMCIGGVSGAIIGSAISKRLDDKKVDKLFLIVLIILIGINIFNVVKFI